MCKTTGPVYSTTGRLIVQQYQPITPLDQRTPKQPVHRTAYLSHSTTGPLHNTMGPVQGTTGPAHNTTEPDSRASTRQQKAEHGLIFHGGSCGIGASERERAFQYM